MTTTNEEMLELAKKCGAVKFITGGNAPTRNEITFYDEQELLAYTSAIEEKYQAQNAMLREALKEVTDIAIGCTEDCPCKQRKALSATQATSDAFVAEVKTREKLAGKIEALQDVIDACNDFLGRSKTNIADGATDAYENIKRAVKAEMAELRNHAQAEGRKGGK